MDNNKNDFKVVPLFLLVFKFVSSWDIESLTWTLTSSAKYWIFTLKVQLYNFNAVYRKIL